MGLLRVRMGAHLTSKGKQTFEKREYKDTAEIVRLLLEDVTRRLQDQQLTCNVQIPAELKKTLQPGTIDEDTATPSSRVDTALSIEEVTGPAHIASKKGFHVGSIVYEKAQGTKSGVYKIIDVGEKVELVEYDHFKKTPINIRIDLERPLSSWALTKDNITTPIDSDWSTRYIGNPAACRVESLRCKLFLALQEACDIVPNPSKLVVLCVKPVSVRSTGNYKKGDLKLLPATHSLVYISTEKGSKAVEVEMDKDWFARARTETRLR